ncbi:MAG: hypothetical protein H7Y11_01940 [Armatimonadetes bacterium]|nr:hypothetical protein [Anaerolineae bacterium]
MTLRSLTCTVSLLLLLIIFAVGVGSTQQGTTPRLTPRSAYDAAPLTAIDAQLPKGISITPLTLNAGKDFPIITHSNSQVVEVFNSVSCLVSDIDNTPLYNLDNSFVRAFKLSDFGITNDIQVQNVQIGIEASLPKNGEGDTQPVNVNLFVLETGDDVVNANLVFVSGASYFVPQIASTETMSYYADFPVNGLVFFNQTLVVEIYVPEAPTSNTFGDRFFIGSNNDGQTDPSYLYAPDCDIEDLTDLAALGYPNMHVVMNVAYEALDTSVTATPLPTETPFSTGTASGTETPSGTEQPGTPTVTTAASATATLGATHTSTPESSATPDATATLTETPATVGDELLINGGFEAKGTDSKPDLTPWAVVNGSNDKIKCNKPEKPIIANTGDCAFQFKGGAGENSKLAQTVDITGMTFAIGETVEISMAMWAEDAASAGKLKLRVKYADGTDTGKLTVDVVVAAGYQTMTGNLAIGSIAVSKIKFSINSTSSSGKLYADDLSLLRMPVGGGAFLPLVSPDLSGRSG